MYYLAIAAANRHVAEYGPSKGKEVANDAYRQVQNGPKSFKEVIDRITTLAATSKPGTKIKLVVTVPSLPMSAGEELAKLKARIAELEKTA